MRAIQRSILSATAAATMTLFAFGCGEPAETPAAPKAAAPVAEAPEEIEAETPDAAPAVAIEADAVAGKADYAMFCASCHGPTGGGDGAVAQALEPKPAKHSDGNYMNPLKDEYLFKVTKLGGASVGKSPLMAPMGGMLSDQQIHNVVAFMRTLADPPYQP